MDAPEPPPALAAALTHERFVRAVAARVLGGDPAVDDVVQETWMRALLAPPRSPGALRAWLGVVARNLAIGRRRAASSRARHESSAGRPAQVPTVASVVAQEDVRRRLVEALVGLDEPYRSTLLVRYREDRTPGEVARLLGVPVATVHTRVRRGLDMLRARLDRDYGHDRRAWALALAPWAPPIASTGASIVIAGGLTMSKSVAAGAMVAAMALATFFAWPPGSGVTPKSNPAAADPRALAATPAPPPGGSDVAPASPSAEGEALAALPHSGRSPASRATAPGGAIPTAEESPFRGVVVSADGTPIAQARLEVRGFQGAPRKAGDPKSVAVRGPSIRTDERGAFTVPGAGGPLAKVAPWAELYVVADGWAPLLTSIHAYEAARIVLTHGGVVSVEVTGVDGRSVQGATLEWRVGASSGAATGGNDAPADLVTTTDDRGRRDEHLTPGVWRLRVRAPGLCPAEDMAFELVEGTRRSTQVVLGEGVVVDVHVVDGEGKAAPAVRIVIGGPRGTSQSAVTDADGRCRIAGIAPASRLPTLLDDPYGTNRLYHRVIRPDGGFQDGDVACPSLPGRFALELALADVVPVRLRVLDPAGRPIPGSDTRLSFRSPSGDPLRPDFVVLKSDSGGVVPLPPLVAGTYWLWVSGPPPGLYLAQRVELRLVHDAVTQDVVLQPAGETLTGRLLGADGNPVARGRVVAVARGGGIGDGASAEVGTDGRFEVRATTGPIDVLASTDGYAPQRTSFETASKPVEIRLRAAGIVAGVVLQPDSTPVPGATVNFARASRSPSSGGSSYETATTRTDAQGRFRLIIGDGGGFLSLVANEWHLRVPGDGPETGLQVRPGEEDLRLVAGPASESMGLPVLAKVFDSDGAPLEGEPLLFYAQADGKSRCAGPERLSAGVYRFSVFSRPEGPLSGAELRVAGYTPAPMPVLDLRRDGAPTQSVEVRLDRGVAVRLRLRTPDGAPLAGEWLEVDHQRLRTDDAGELEVWGRRAGDPVFGSIRTVADPAYTFAEFRAEHAPATIDLVLRRRGTVSVVLPVTWNNRKGEAVFLLKRADGSVVAEERVPRGRYADAAGPIQWVLPVFEAGEFVAEARCDGATWSSTVSASLGRAVVVPMK